MLQYRNLKLCNSVSNDDKPIVFKSFKGTKSVEPVGIVFFITREWSINVSFQGIFNPTSLQVSESTAECAKEYLTYTAKLDQSFVYGLKSEWAKHLFDQSEPEPLEDVVITDKKKKKLGNSKSLGLIRNFISQDKNAYELLDCSDFDSMAKIKASYRKIVLLLHPDKSGKVSDDMQEYAKKFNIESMDEEGRKQMFLLIQDAFTILSDPILRHEYDCNLPFDENIPTHEEARTLDFFKLFSPVFEMNSRWSKTKPVPQLGIMDTPDEQIDEFYEFWRSFETERTFSHAAPYLLEEAECREEKRWMERENLKVQRKLVKKELIRIQKLVDLAEASDPRVKARQERAKREKLERQKKIEEEKRLQMHELEMENERKKQELEKVMEKTRYEKQIVKRFRQHLRIVATKLETDPEPLEKLATLSYEFLKGTCENVYKLFGHARTISPDEESFQFIKDMGNVLQTQVSETDALLGVLKDVYKELGVDIKREDTVTPVENVKEQAPVDECIWTPEELVSLSKAMDIYGAGVPGRWNLVSKFVKTKSVGECIQMGKKITKEVEWTPQQQTALEDALRKYPSTMEPVERWKMIASEVEGKTAKECVNRFKMLKAAVAASSSRK
ncbi:DNA-binding chaperone, putative [Theileria equi strain WA]|uniref:DNA-binding chaperone, putative n=1 Tax=Theileria equi strain WA TaxID=1537102 RepID=L0B110_THEEQ|nr:DNA-binding chaperone, putative [Theileria equi strain WA]AFZ81505.1 DNA-binding chaperone, putative [Theileria equi strain WA]|eukprot:XP_004831171.1 DNA-binding chaperone, putative [Theileria equi strain WA]